MTIQKDLADTFIEVGSLVTIEGSAFSGEYIDSEESRRNMPFYKEFVREGAFKSTTNIQQSSIVKFSATEERYLVVDRRPEMFENEVIKYNGILYMCNVKGSVLRYGYVSGESEPYDSNFRIQKKWNTIATDQWAPLFVEGFVKSELDERSDFVNIVQKDKELYLPENIGAQVDDRFKIDSNEYYRITNVEKHKFENIVVCQIGIDNRSES